MYIDTSMYYDKVVYILRYDGMLSNNGQTVVKNTTANDIKQ